MPNIVNKISLYREIFLFYFNMNLDMYKQCIEFQNLDSKHWTNDCVICYIQIIPSENVGFNCSHNCCISCFTIYLNKVVKRKDVITCFVCRNPIYCIDVNNIDSQKKIKNIIEPQREVTLYKSNRMFENDSQISDNDFDFEFDFDSEFDPRPYQRVSFNYRDFRVFYIMSQSSLLLLLLCFGYCTLFYMF